MAADLSRTQPHIPIQPPQPVSLHAVTLLNKYNFSFLKIRSLRKLQIITLLLIELTTQLTTMDSFSTIEGPRLGSPATAVVAVEPESLLAQATDPTTQVAWLPHQAPWWVPSPGSNAGSRGATLVAGTTPVAGATSVAGSMPVGQAVGMV